MKVALELLRQGQGGESRIADLEAEVDAAPTARGRAAPARAALVQRLGVAAPVRTPSAVAEGHVKGSQRTEGGFAVFDKRYWPGDKITDHLSFALRREPIDLLILKRAFDAIPAEEMAVFIREAPTGALARRATASIAGGVPTRPLVPHALA